MDKNHNLTATQGVSEPMAFNTPFSGAQFWAQQQHPFHTPTNMHHGLNPSVPGFQPNGTEMQRYQQRPPTPPSSNPATPVDILQMKRFVLDNHFSHTKDVTTLERKAEKNSHEIENIKDVVGRDMRSLQHKIQNLEQKVAVQQQQNGAPTGQSRADQVVGPSEELSNNFSKQQIAEAYLEEAEDHEKAAVKLREQVENICSGAGSRKLVTLKLLDGPNGTNGIETKAGFACCGSDFGSIQEMLEHVCNAHGLHPEQSECSNMANGSGESTPTHVPPRHAKMEKPSSAEEAKAAENIEGRTPKPETDDVKEKGADEDMATANTANNSTHSLKARPDNAASPASGKWLPLAVQKMKLATTINTHDKETFTWEFLKLTLNGEQWSPGFYFISPQSSVLKSSAYWVLDAEWEPYLPSTPGEHGAKLTAFFNETLSNPGEAPDEDNYKNTPVFMCPEGKSEYVYLGNYSQVRFSDKLDYDRVMAVPEKVRRYWAEQLAAEGRPEWVTRCLMEHFWPRPTYNGPIPEDTEASNTEEEEANDEAHGQRVSRALSKYAQELKEWEKDARIKASCLSADNIMDAFGNADADEVAGLRLWWEYLECKKYDQEFYDFLVQLKQNPKLQTAGIPTTPRPKAEVGGKIVKPTNGVETVKLQTTPPQLKQSKQTPSTVATADTKRHTHAIKPWEVQRKDPAESQGKLDGPKTPNGDMDVAKQLQKEFEKSSGKQGGNGNGLKGAAYVAPHLRGKR